VSVSADGSELVLHCEPAQVPAVTV